MRKSFFIGYTDIAGVGSRLESGFRNLGHRSDFYYFGKHMFNYKGGKLLKFSNHLWVSRFQKIFFIIYMIFRYSNFIYIGSGTSLLRRAKEIDILKFFGKKTMIVYVGCDVRMPEVVEKYKWNTCVNCPDSYKKFVGCVIEKKKRNINREQRQFNIVLSPLECGGFLKSGYKNILFPIDLNEFNFLNKRKADNKLKILHAPSNSFYKGSKYIIDAIERLKYEGYIFEFKLVQNISIDELYQEIISSDLIIDQLLGGFYGLFAIESMAFGKPVICFIRDDAKEFETPIINANPDTIYFVIKDIVQDPSVLRQIGYNSRKYVEAYHSDTKVCSDIIDHFSII